MYRLLNVVLILILLIGVGSWAGNLYKLVFEDDFEAPVKAEILHGAGVFVPPLAIITVWVDDEVSDDE